MLFIASVSAHVVYRQKQERHRTRSARIASTSADVSAKSGLSTDDNSEHAGQIRIAFAS